MAETSGKQEDDPHEDGSWLLEGRGGVDRARDVDSDGVLEGDGVVDEYDAEAVRRAFDESNGHGHDADGTDELRSGEEDDAEMARDAGVVDGITVAAPHEASPLPFGPVQTQDAQVEQAADPVAAAKAAVADEAKVTRAFFVGLSRLLPPTLRTDTCANTVALQGQTLHQHPDIPLCRALPRATARPDCLPAFPGRDVGQGTRSQDSRRNQGG